jgi:hypothetical protein
MNISLDDVIFFGFYSPLVVISLPLWLGFPTAPSDLFHFSYKMLVLTISIFSSGSGFDLNIMDHCDLRDACW